MTHKLISNIAILACTLTLGACGGGGTTTPTTQKPAANTPPTISGSAPSSITVGGAYSFTPTASDADGDTLSFSLQNQPSWMDVESTSGKLSGRPAVGDEGNYTNIAVSASDGAAITMMTAFSVRVEPNSAPSISGTPPSRIIAGQDFSFTPVVSDLEGDQLTFSIQNLPTWAVFSSSTGQVSGTPQSQHVGRYPDIRIEVSDQFNSATLAAFTLEVETLAFSNNPPVVSGSPATTVTSGKSYSFIPNAYDPDGDALTFSLQNKPGWMTLNLPTGVLGGTPGIADIGEYTDLVLMATDGQSTVSLPAFTLTVVPGTGTNTAPTISGSPATSVVAGSAYVFVPIAFDADGDSLSFSIQNRPSWAAFSSLTGALTGLPDSGNAGEYATVLISVSDGTQSATLPSFTITVTATNAAPVISGTPPTSVDVGSSYNFTPDASDADGDDLTFSINNAPPWATFRASDGRLSGTPSQDDVGTNSSIVISVSDGSVTTALAPFTISVIGNTAPTISGTPVTALNVGETYAFTPTGNDADGDTLTFSIENMPPWAAFSTSTGTLSGIADPADVGSYANIVISVTDGTDSVSLLAFTLVVSEVTTGSATISWTPPTQNEDGSTLSNLSGYRFYYGTSSGSYTGQVDVDVAGISTYMIENLAPGTYYFVVTALSTAGLESAYSEEVVAVIDGN